MTSEQLETLYGFADRYKVDIDSLTKRKSKGIITAYIDFESRITNDGTIFRI